MTVEKRPGMTVTKLTDGMGNVHYAPLRCRFAAKGYNRAAFVLPYRHNLLRLCYGNPRQ